MLSPVRVLLSPLRGEFCDGFFSSTFEVLKELKGWIWRVFLVLSSGVFTRISARKLFRQSLKLLVLKDHDFGRNPTFPPYAFHPCPFYVGISLCIGKGAIGMF